MAYLPELSAIQTQSLYTQEFKGYRHKPVIGDGELYDMANLTGEHYPLLATRDLRQLVGVAGIGTGLGRINGAIGVNVPSRYVSGGGNNVYLSFLAVGTELWALNGQNARLIPGVTLVEARHQMVVSGSYLIIWPDKVYVNIYDALGDGTVETGSIEKITEKTGATVTMCRLDGTEYTPSEITTSDTAPANPTNGQLWLDTSGDTHILKQYNEGTTEWIQVATVYAKISATGLGDGFSDYDCVTIETESSDTDTDAVLKEKLNGDFILYKVEENAVIVAVGVIDTALTGVKVKLSRTAPDLDFIVERDNRIWGCVFDLDKKLNEIRACALGDWRNWNRYMGLSTDSYAVSVGTEGVFTGMACYGNQLLCFKEDAVHILTGTMPSTFAVDTQKWPGVHEGSTRSIATVGNALIWKGVKDFWAYDGSLPVCISEPLGDGVGAVSAACGYNGRYYAGTVIGSNTYMMVYDIGTGMWHKEDRCVPFYMWTVGDALLYVDASQNYAIRAEKGYAFVNNPEAGIQWSATFGTFGYEVEPQKYLSRFNIRGQMTSVGERRAKLKIEIQYDSDGVWHDEGTVCGPDLQTFTIPVIPRRCDHCQLRLSGEGQFRLYSLGRVLEVGGDVEWHG